MYSCFLKNQRDAPKNYLLADRQFETFLIILKVVNLIGTRLIHFWFFLALVKQVYTVILHVPPTRGFGEQFTFKKRFRLISGFPIEYM